MKNKNESSTQKPLLPRILLLFKPHMVWVCISLLLILLSAFLGVLTPKIIRNIVDVLQRNTTYNLQSLATIKHNLFQFIGISGANAIAMFFSTVLMTYLVQRIILSIRQHVIQHSLKQSMAYFHNEPIGKMVTFVTNDLDKIGTFFQTVFSQIISSIISLSMVIGMLFFLSWELALYTLILLPLILLFINFYRKKILQKAKIERQTTVKLNVYLSEHLQGAMDLQIHNKTQESITNFQRKAEEHLTAQRQLGLQRMLMGPLLNFMLNIITAVVLIAGSVLIHKGLITVGIIIAFFQLIQQFFSPIFSIAQNIYQTQEAMASLERIFDFLDMDTTIPQISHAYILPKSTKGILTFHNVSFAYTERKDILKNITFTLEPDKTLALVGHSGSGKSTISRLCVRFWDPAEGHITLDGHDIRTMALSDLRNTITLLQQDSFILKGSIRENITIGRTIPQRKLDDLAEQSDLKFMLANAANSWDTEIQKNMLSVGEQRIIAICRVLAHPPKIILLDEFSATLDHETESTVNMLLKTLQKGRSSLIIAHRLNTIKSSNEILYLHEGIIVERGTHETLLANKGPYAKMLKEMRHTMHDIV